MKKFFLTLMFLLVFACRANAQNVSFESVQLATHMVEQNWSQVENMFRLIEPGLRAELEKGSATKDAAKTFSEEFFKNITKENIAKSFAEILRQEFTDQEIAQINSFATSPIGKKYTQLFNDPKQSERLVKPALRAACDASSKKLGFFDRGSLNSMCRGQ